MPQHTGQLTPERLTTLSADALTPSGKERPSWPEVRALLRLLDAARFTAENYRKSYITASGHKRCPGLPWDPS